MNSVQFSLLLNKLEKLQKERKEEEAEPAEANSTRIHPQTTSHHNPPSQDHHTRKQAQPSAHSVSSHYQKQHTEDGSAPANKGSQHKLGATNMGLVRMPTHSHQNENKYPKDISKYEVLETLGAGTFGRVKQVLAPNREVLALKQISKSHIINLKQVEHIKLEKRILNELNHPFIYSLKTSFQDDVFIYMIFEYCSGGQLFNRLRKDGRFSNDVAMFYICEILLAICYMHDKGIIYRDLKPENLLIDKDGHVKIADFGFAKKLLHDKTYTLCGTPEYLAPQIILGSKQGYGKSADWWALGILVYELMTGQ